VNPRTEALRAEARLKNIVDATPVPLMLLDADDAVVFVNPAFTKTFGFTATSLPTLTAWWARACPNPDYREVMVDTWKGLVLSAEDNDVPSLPMEVEIHCEGGATRTVLASPVRLDEEERVGLMMVLYDITERTTAKEHLRRSETLLSIAGQIARLGGWTIDLPEYRITWSDEACLLHGFPPGTAPTFDQALALYLPAERERLRVALRACAAGGLPFDLECEGVTASGTQVFLRTLGQAERDPRGNVRRVHGALQDITRRKQTEIELTRTNEALRSSLAEKDALLKEVHHRVKNNMQVITSLLRLESSRIDHPATKTVLKDMQNRIRAMAVLHESLYRSGSFARVDLAAYLRELTAQLQRSMIVGPGEIGFDLDLTEATLGLHQAIPCGLIVNELVSNALKHGFPLGRSGRIRISLERVDGALRLRVADNGAGLPPDFESNRKHSLGLQLVADLARQLRGRFEVGAGQGATFDVTFTPSAPPDPGDKR
jgi:PAS domain S-box-containing protein